MSLAVPYDAYDTDSCSGISITSTVSYSNTENLNFVENEKPEDSFSEVSSNFSDSEDQGFDMYSYVNESHSSSTHPKEVIKFNISKPNYKKFCIFLAIGTLFWAIMLAIGVSLYVIYHKKCKFYNSFELFGICLLVYINIRYIFDFIIGLITYYKHSKVTKQEDENDQVLLQNETLASQNPEPKYRATDHSCLLKTVDMSKKIQHYLKNDAYMQDILSKKLPFDVDFTQEQLMSALTNVGNIREKWSLNKHKYTDLHNIHNLKFGLEAIPLLSVIFFLIIGINAFHSNYVYSTNILLNTGCQSVTIFNWILVCLFIIHSLFKLLPILMSLFYNSSTTLI